MADDASEPEILPPARVSFDKTAPGDTPPADGPDPEVGYFDQNNPLTAAMLARYLVGRAIAARLSAGLMVIALVIVALAVVVWLLGPHWFAVLIGLVALVVLAFRALLMAILRRLTAVGRLGAAEDKIRALVKETRGDLRRELRRLGLPSSVVGLPLLAWRLIGRRRKETLRKLGDFDVTRVVPAGRLSELAFVVRHDVLGRPGRAR